MSFVCAKSPTTTLLVIARVFMLTPIDNLCALTGRIWFYIKCSQGFWHQRVCAYKCRMCTYGVLLKGKRSHEPHDGYSSVWVCQAPDMAHKESVLFSTPFTFKPLQNYSREAYANPVKRASLNQRLAICVYELEASPIQLNNRFFWAVSYGIGV